MRFLVDTNVFLDLLLDRENAINAEIFFNYCLEQKHEIYISAMTLRDAGYVANHILHDWKKSRLIQNNIYSVCTKVVSVTSDAAIESLYSDSKDYEDCVLMEAAEENMCDAIITSNLRDFQLSQIQVYSLERINQLLRK